MCSFTKLAEFLAVNSISKGPDDNRGLRVSSLAIRTEREYLGSRRCRKSSDAFDISASRWNQRRHDLMRRGLAWPDPKPSGSG
jgi:hypothetical protein